MCRVGRARPTSGRRRARSSSSTGCSRSRRSSTPAPGRCRSTSRSIPPSGVRPTRPSASGRDCWRARPSSRHDESGSGCWSGRPGCSSGAAGRRCCSHRPSSRRCRATSKPSTTGWSRVGSTASTTSSRACGRGPARSAGSSAGVRLARALARSDVILLDDSFPPLTWLKLGPKVRIIQLWHASGAFKTVGYSRVGKPARRRPVRPGPQGLHRGHRELRRTTSRSTRRRSASRRSGSSRRASRGWTASSTRVRRRRVWRPLARRSRRPWAT